jgi:hypothetical protein
VAASFGLAEAGEWLEVETKRMANLEWFLEVY